MHLNKKQWKMLPNIKCSVVKFLNWMLSPDSGIQNEKSAKQHVTHARVTLKAMGKQDMSALWDYSPLDTFLAHADEKSFLPATTKSYLNSLAYTVYTADLRSILNVSPLLKPAFFHDD